MINPIIKKGFNDKTCENLSILINLMMLNVDKIDKSIKKEILTQLFILINQLWDNEHKYSENDYILKIQCDFESEIAKILYSSIFDNNLMTLFDKEIKSNDLLFYIFSPDNYLFEKFNNLKKNRINEIYNNHNFEIFIKNFEAQKNNLLIYSSLINNFIIDEIQYKIYERKEKTKNIIENIIEAHEKFNYQNQKNLEKLRYNYFRWGKYLKNISNNKKWKKVFYIEYNIINNDDLFLFFKNIKEPSIQEWIKMKDFRERFYYDKNILEFLGITKKKNNNIIKNYHYQNKYFEILELSDILSSKEKILKNIDEKEIPILYFGRDKKDIINQNDFSEIIKHFNKLFENFYQLLLIRNNNNILELINKKQSKIFICFFF